MNDGTVLGAIATLFGMAAIGIAALLAISWLLAIIEDRKTGKRDRLLGAALLKACGGDLTRAWAEVERARWRRAGDNVAAHNQLYQRIMRNTTPEERAAREHPELYRQYKTPPAMPPIRDDERPRYKPQPQVDRAGANAPLPPQAWHPAGANWWPR